jgi:hypothetical protein
MSSGVADSGPPGGTAPAAGAMPVNTLAPARRLGRLEGEEWDRQCRERERLEREERLAGFALNHPPGAASSSLGAGASSSEVARLRSQVEALSAFQTAVLRSRSWRLLQALRRPFGRAW